MERGDRRRLWRRAAALGLLWAGMTALGTWRHVAHWVAAPSGDIAMSSSRGAAAGGGLYPDLVHATEGASVHAMDNALHMLCQPGWQAVAAAAGRESLHSPTLAVAASGLSAALWILLGCATLYVRRVLLTWRRAEPAARSAGHETGAVRFSIDRRRFLIDAPLTLAGVGALGVAARSTLVDPWGLEVRRYRVAIRDLPASFEGLRIAQVSDLHCGPRVAREFLHEAIEKAISLKPDLFVLTGDYVSHGPAQIPHAAELIGRLVERGGARFGVAGVLGNHDWYAGGGAVRAALQQMGVHMVDNDRIYLDGASGRVMKLPPTGPALCLAGLGDLLEDVVVPETAFAGVDEAMPRIVLAHHPDTAELPLTITGVGAGAEHRARIDLMFSGHTHGGQVRLPFIGSPIVPSAYGQKYVGGLVQGPAFPVVVSRGVGMSILPVRFCVAPELVVVELERA